VDSHGIIEGCRKAEDEAISGARWLALRGPADHDKFCAVEAFNLAPQAAIAGRGIRAHRFRLTFGRERSPGGPCTHLSEGIEVKRKFSASRKL
jgi:hypothetical protein